MLYDQQAVAAFLQDGHELEDGEGPADLQGGEPAVQAAQEPGVVAADEEDLKPLQVKVPVQGSGQHGQGRHQDMPGPVLESNGWVQFEVHENILSPGQGISSRNARGESDWCTGWERPGKDAWQHPRTREDYQSGFISSGLLSQSHASIACLILGPSCIVGPPG